MRTIILSIIIGVVGCAALTTNEYHLDSKITLYVFNYEADISGQPEEKDFWSSPNGLDTVEIKGPRLVNHYLKKFNSLKDTALYQPDELDDFYHAFAFVFKNEKGKSDTIYADLILRFFEWKGRKKYYEDTTGFFRKSFESFRVYHRVWHD